VARSASEWASVEKYARRQELYARAATVFRRYGYRNATLKALANACGLSIPALYRYFPSKRAFALFPLVALYPELSPAPPQVDDADAADLLSGWIDAAAEELSHYTLALRLAREIELTAAEQRRIESNLTEHAAMLGLIARRAAPNLSERRARELAGTMINIASGPASTGLQTDPAALRRQLRTLLRGYGVVLPPSARSRPSR
jgi:AcrR family transcriptional regulator